VNLPCSNVSNYFTEHCFQISFYLRDVFRQVNILGQNHMTLLQGTLHVDIFKLVTEVDSLLDQADKAILDLDVRISPLLNLPVESTASLDNKLLTTFKGLRSAECHLKVHRNQLQWLYVHSGGVGVQINIIDMQNVVRRTGAVVQRVIAWDLGLVIGIDTKRSLSRIEEIWERGGRGEQRSSEESNGS
jgi:hypothetical protein